MASSFSEPLPRYCHHSAVVGGKIFIYGGHTKDFSKEKKELSVSVHSFNQCLETWQTRATTGKHPPGLYAGACTSSGHHLYLYGGLDGLRRHNTLYQLDTDTLEWLQLPSGPMRKTGCSMVFYKDKLILFGGYGTRSSPTQPEAEFVLNTSTAATGWTNELHVFDTKRGKWSSPTVTGSRPPPCRDFSLTMIDQDHAVLFGGHVPTHGTSNDVYTLDLRKMHWTLLDNVQLWPMPVGRDRHAAICLWNDKDEPQLLVTGGRNENGKVLSDAWLFNPQTKRWREIFIPRLKARCALSAAAVKLSPGVVEVTLFGGSPKWPKNAKTATDIPQIAKTTVLRFEYWESPPSVSAPTGEWILKNMADSSLLGTMQRIEDKIQATSASARAHRAEKRAQEAEERCREAEKRCRKVMEERDKGIQEAEDRVSEAEERCMKADDMAREAEARWKEAEDQAREAERGWRTADVRAVDAERGLREAGSRASQAERRWKEAETQATEIEKRWRATEERAIEAERRQREAEGRAIDSERGRREAENRATDLERRLTTTENRVVQHESNWRDCEAKLQRLETQWAVKRREIHLTGPEIGRGGWATVYVATFRGVRVAAKRIHNQIISDYNIHLFKREMDMASRIRHPNLLQFIGATQRGELIILTELMPTSLRKELENLHGRSLMPIRQVTSIAVDVARALNYLHLMTPKPLVHRDISSANVLLQPLPYSHCRAKVSDYGTVNLFHELQTINPGNPMYAAPEASDPTKQSPQMDIFSFGVLLVEMLTGEFPDSTNRARQLRKISRQPLLALVQSCLSQDRNKRPSANRIIAELEF